jgi:hypothetical protein
VFTTGLLLTLAWLFSKKMKIERKKERKKEEKQLRHVAHTTCKT